MGGESETWTIAVPIAILAMTLRRQARAPAWLPPELQPAARAASVRVLDVLRAADDAGAVCPVCAEAIAGTSVCRGRCGTPHHPDCGAYVGMCSVFACQGTEWRKP